MLKAGWVKGKKKKTIYYWTFIILHKIMNTARKRNVTLKSFHCSDKMLTFWKTLLFSLVKLGDAKLLLLFHFIFWTFLILVFHRILWKFCYLRTITTIYIGLLILYRKPKIITFNCLHMATRPLSISEKTYLLMVATNISHNFLFIVKLYYPGLAVKFFISKQFYRIMR